MVSLSVTVLLYPHRRSWHAGSGRGTRLGQEVGGGHLPDRPRCRALRHPPDDQRQRIIDWCPGEPVTPEAPAIDQVAEEEAYADDVGGVRMMLMSPQRMRGWDLRVSVWTQYSLRSCQITEAGSPNCQVELIKIKISDLKQ